MPAPPATNNHPRHPRLLGLGRRRSYSLREDDSIIELDGRTQSSPYLGPKVTTATTTTSRRKFWPKKVNDISETSRFLEDARDDDDVVISGSSDERSAALGSTTSSKGSKSSSALKKVIFQRLHKKHQASRTDGEKYDTNDMSRHYSDAMSVFSYTSATPTVKVTNGSDPSPMLRSAMREVRKAEIKTRRIEQKISRIDEDMKRIEESAQDHVVEDDSYWVVICYHNMKKHWRECKLFYFRSIDKNTKRIEAIYGNDDGNDADDKDYWVGIFANVMKKCGDGMLNACTSTSTHQDESYVGRDAPELTI